MTFQLPLLSETWTVGELTRYIRQMFESDYRLQDVAVSGELSNLARPRSGHMYFTLKDADASLRCVMWRRQVAHLTYQPQEGDQVVAHGKLGVYEASGQYQLYVERVHLSGAGDLFQRFEARKQQLEAEGLFDSARKRALPRWPRLLALVTSPTGAAVQDMLTVIARRWPLLDLVVAPTAVQGEAAPAEIVAALDAANRLEPDAILLARGGGSLEDLWAFNEEDVARAIFNSRAPVVTGVGHETDFTIADFVADLRAPTPSAAAELATPDMREQRQVVDGLFEQLALQVREQVQNSRWALAEQQALLWGLSPRSQLAAARQKAAGLSYRAALATRNLLRLQREHINGLTQTLSGLGPTETLARGYAIVSRADTAEVVRSKAQVGAGDALRVRVADGGFEVVVSDHDDI